MKAPGETGDRAAQLSAARKALLAKRIRGQAAPAGSPAGLAKRTDTSPAPASAAQVRLHFLAELFPDSAAYHMHTAVRLDGALDAEALATALSSVVARHDSLRTTFRTVDGRLCQIVVPDAQVPLARVDLSSVSAEFRDRELERHAVDEIRRPFDLSAGPPCRACLFRFDGTQHVLVFTAHHIVTDEWSANVFLRELAALYAERSGGSPAALPALPATYGDFAAWQATRIAEIEEAQLGYWRQALDGADPRLDLPVDHARPPRLSLDGALRRRTLQPGLDDALQRIARDAGATPFMTLLAAFQTLLYRYTGQDDISVGTPAANRMPRETEALVGLFLNSVILRARPTAELPFTGFLKDVREVALGAYANQELPLERLVAALRPERDIGHNPLFQVMFVMETEPLDGVRFPGLDAELLLFDTGTSKFDLTLFVGGRGDAMWAAIEYDTALFERATIDRMLASFDVLLAGIAADPACRLGDLPILPDEDVRLLASWTAEFVERDRTRLLPERFVARCAETPEAAAVVAGETRLSYGELGALVGRVAQDLRAQGVNPGDLVGIHLDRSVEQLAAMLGVLHIGAAYVPLDPAYPAEHIGSILADLARCRPGSRAVVLCSAGRESALPPSVVAVQVAGLPADTTTDTLPPAQPVSPDALAYVLYTSGTTGTPKGVTISHGNLLHSTQARLEYYREPVGRYLLVSSFAFDSSVAGLYWTLASGGTLVLPAPGVERDPEQLAACIERYDVTHTLMLPALYELVLQRAAPAQLGSLRTVIVAGEACRPALIEHHFAALPQARLYNEYGPTECTVWATVHACTGEEAGSVPIGRPIHNMRGYVLDEALRCVPVGVGGELCLAGDGVSPGYLDPERESWRFVDEPWATAGLRLYRTGDRARFRADGSLEFLGRLDGQVKIRGFRIEPDGIEAVLERHEQVIEAAVAVRSDAAGSRAGMQRLVAYVVGSDGVSTQALRDHARQALPEYMVPAAFVLVPSLPRSPNGKLDRARLPAVEQVTGERSGELAYADSTEAELALIWGRALGVDVVASDDDFFALGGHSLLGVALMLEVERRFKVELPLATLFEAPRLCEFSARLRGAGGEIGERFLIPIQPNGTRPPVFCVHGGARLLARYLGPDQPVYLAFQHLGELEAEGNSVERMAAKYLAEVRAVQPEGPYHLVGFSFGGQIAYEMAQLLRRDGQEVALLALCDPPTLIDQSYFVLRVRRKLAQMATAGDFGDRLRYLLREAPAIVVRGIGRLRWRLASAYYARTQHWGWLRPRTGFAVFGAGLAAMALGGLIMNGPDWQPVVEPFQMRAGTAIETGFVASQDGEHDIELRFERTLPKAVLRQTVLKAKEPAPVDLRWQVAREDGSLVASGDVADYLYIDHGAQSLAGRLRRVLLRVPFGQNERYFQTFGLSGSRTVSRGVGSFPADADTHYLLRAELGTDLGELDVTHPALVVRLSRRTFKDHYDTVAPIGYGGLTLCFAGLLLAAVSVLRSRQSVPDRVVEFRDYEHYVRVGNRYRYQRYDGDALLLLPEHYAQALEPTLEKWRKVIAGRLSWHVVAGATRHLDLIHEPGGTEVAETLAGVLSREQPHADGPQPPATGTDKHRIGEIA